MFGGGYSPDDGWNDSQQDDNERAEWLFGNYECLACNNRTNISGEHKRVAKNWCNVCEQIRPHEKRDES